MFVHFKNIRLHFFVSLLTLFLGVISCQAQDTAQIKKTNRLEKADIQWLSQWPSPDNKHAKKKINQHLKNLIFGKKKEELSRPVALLAISHNSFWILDQENNAVFQVINNIGKIPHFIDKKNNSFSSLVGICKFHQGEMLFTDSYSNKIFLVNSEKKECTVLNDSLKLDKPTGIAYSLVTNEIWVVETGTHCLVILNDKGEIIKRVGSRGTDKGEFNFPTHIWIDKKGNVYITDAMNFRVQVFNKNAEVISVFGSNGDASGYFASPKGIATDSHGHIYIVDALFHVIQIFDIDGNFLYAFGSQGRNKGEFWMPSGIFIDEKDLIYIADSYNSRIQIFQLITGE